MSYDACARMVAEGDPDRFATAMTARPAKRGHLMVLYAFNLEVARAPWVTSEPMLAEMRVQWWADAVREIYEGKAPRRHEVVTPLAETIRAHALAEPLFDRLIEARRSDITPDAPDALETYIADTSGALMELAAQALGTQHPAIAEIGYAQGLANLLCALPELKARGYDKLHDTSDTAIQTLAADALTRLSKARAQRREIAPEATPALLTAWQAQRILTRAASQPSRVWQANLRSSAFRQKTGLALRATFGRW